MNMTIQQQEVPMAAMTVTGTTVAANLLYKDIRNYVRDNFWIRISQDDLLGEADIEASRVRLINFSSEAQTSDFVDFVVQLVNKQADAKAERQNWKLQQNAINEGTNLLLTAEDQEKWFNAGSIPQPILTSALAVQLGSENVKVTALAQIANKIEETRERFMQLDQEMQQFITENFV